MADDPSLVDEIASETIRLRSGIDQAERAVGVVSGRVQVAEREFLQAEMARCEAAEVVPAQEAFDAHQAKVEDLRSRP